MSDTPSAPAPEGEYEELCKRLETPVYTFAINRIGEPNIEVEGDNRFAVEKEVAPLTKAAREAANALRTVLREREEANRQLQLLGSACDKIRLNASAEWREENARAIAAETRLAEATKALRYWDEAFATGRSEPLFIARDNGRATLSRMEDSK